MMKANTKKLYKKYLMVLLSAPLLVLVSMAIWQDLSLDQKNRTIARLLRENSLLRKNLVNIDGQFLELKDAATDIREMQNELVKVIKDIHHSHPVTSANLKDRFDPIAKVIDKPPGIFYLSSSKENLENLRFDAKGLLETATTLKEILNHTPSMVPVSNGYISSDYGRRTDPFTDEEKMHYGLDFSVARGSPIVAAGAGPVIFTGKKTGYGQVVEIKHKDGLVTRYAHLEKILVKDGQEIKRGQEIGTAGSTGRSQSPHLHFEILKGKQRLDPKPFLISPAPQRFL